MCVHRYSESGLTSQTLYVCIQIKHGQIPQKALFLFATIFLAIPSITKGEIKPVRSHPYTLACNTNKLECTD